MWLLATVLPLLIGDLISESSEHWYCFLLLLKICSIAAAREIKNSSIEYLSVIIEEHHKIFTKLYPEKNIIPKMHYMLHYPSQIRNFGPLIHSWTMRYESKLRVLKRASRHGNFKNICKTVAKKHQHLLCYYLNSSKQFLHRDIEVGPIESTTSLSQYTEFHEYICDKMSVSMEEKIDQMKFIKFESLTLKRGACVLIGVGELYPKFCKITDLISFRSFYYLKLQECKTEFYDSHLNSYSVSFLPSFHFLPVSSLPLYPLLHIRMLCNASRLQFLTLKHFIEI